MPWISIAGHGGQHSSHAEGPWMKRTSPHPIDAYPGPGIRDWALLAIGVGFTGAGLLILPFNPNVGIVTIALFGLSAVVFATTIVRKLRFRRPRPLRAEIVGGVPIRRSRAIVLGRGGISLRV